MEPIATFSPEIVPSRNMQFSSSSFIILLIVKFISFLISTATPLLACVEWEKNLYLSLNKSETYLTLLPNLTSERKIMSELRLIIEATFILVFLAKAETFMLLQFCAEIVMLKSSGLNT